MKRFIITLLCIMLVIPLGLVGCKDKDDNVVRVCEVTHSVFYAPLYIAINNGYFEEYDIEIELSNGGGADKCMNALVSKSADIALMGPEATIYVANQGKDDMPVVFGQLTQRDGSFIIGRENITNFTWDALANKTILGGRRGGVPAMTLEYAIEKNNVQNCTINYDVAFDNLTSAFIGGTGDFVTAFEPAASQIVASGNGHIIASVGAETGEIPYTAFTANRSYINANEDTIKNFLRAIIRGYNYLISSDIDDVINAIRPSFDGTTDEMLRVSLEAYREIDAWSRTPVMSSVAYNNLMNIIINSGTLTTAVDMNKVVDNSYAQAVLKDFA